MRLRTIMLFDLLVSLIAGALLWLAVIFASLGLAEEVKSLATSSAAGILFFQLH